MVAKTKDDSIVIYTDGSASPNPGAGGWGCIVPIDDKTEIKLSGGFVTTTNNRMELLAVIKALEEFGPNKTFDIYIDSEYAKNGLTMWMHGWHRKGWKRFDFNTGLEIPIKNLDLWQKAYPLYKENKIYFHKVKAHTGDKYNEMVDVLAKEASKGVTAIDEGYQP